MVNQRPATGVSTTSLLITFYVDETMLKAYEHGSKHELSRADFGRVLTIAWRLHPDYTQRLRESDLRRFDWAKAQPARRLKQAGQAAVDSVGLLADVFTVALEDLHHTVVEEKLPDDPIQARRLLELLLDPSRTERKSDEEAEFHASIQDISEAVRERQIIELQTILRLQRNEVSGNQLIEAIPEFAQRLIDDANARSEQSVLAELANVSPKSATRDRPVAPTAPPLDGDQGVVLTALLAARGARPPCAVRELVSADQIEAWLAAARDTHWLRSLLLRCRPRADHLVSAAAQQEFRLSTQEPLVRRGRTPVVVDDFQDTRRSLLSSVLPSLVETTRLVSLSEIDLRARLREYRLGQPTLRTRVAAVAGVIGGALAFVAGVVAPVLWDDCPKAVSVWIPPIWHLIVLIVVSAVAVQRATKV